MLSEHGILVKFTPNWMLEQEFRTQHERASIGHCIDSITTFWDAQNNHSGEFLCVFFYFGDPFGFRLLGTESFVGLVGDLYRHDISVVV